MTRNTLGRWLGASIGVHAVLAAGLVVASLIASSDSAQPGHPPQAIMVTLVEQHPQRIVPSPVARPLAASALRSVPDAFAHAEVIPDAVATTEENADLGDSQTEPSSVIGSIAAPAASVDPIEGEPSGASSDGLDGYRPLVLAALERAKRYPFLAKERGLEGTVEIAFTIHPDGRISAPRVMTSSRVRILDDATLSMVRRVGLLPPPPEAATLRFPARISYRLDLR